MPKIGQELLNVPFAEMISEVGRSIGEAQFNMDKNSVEILRVMGNQEEAPVVLPSLEVENNKVTKGTMTTSMIGAGFQPNFYQFAETVIEVKMSMTAVGESENKKDYHGNVVSSTTLSTSGRTRRKYMTVTPIDATYSNKYNFTQEGSSLLRTRLVPVPPNQIMQKQIELLAQYEQKKYVDKLDEVEEKMNE